MDSIAIVSLPVPPRSAPEAGGSSKIEDVIITLLDGTSLSAQLLGYSSAKNNITLGLIGKTEQKILPLNQIKNFQLVNSRHFTLDSQYLDQDDTEQNASPENHEFILTSLDGSSITLETLGHIKDDNGIHLFVVQAFFNYYHMFVPYAAMKKNGDKPALALIPVGKENDSEQLVEDPTTPQNTGLNNPQKETHESPSEIKPEAIESIPEIESKAVESPAELEAAIKKNENSPNIRLGEALIQEGLITDAQLQLALADQTENRDVPLGEILVNMRAVTSDEMKKTLASKLGIPFVNIKRFAIDVEAANMVSEKICRRHNVMPLCIYDSKLIVAVENPLYRLPLEHLRFHTKTFVEAVMAAPEDIEWAIGKHHGTQINEIALALDEDDDDDEEFDHIAESDNALVNLVNKMIMDAHAQGVSDIHIEPYPGKKKTLVRFRKDGELVPYVELAPSYRSALISRLKVMCDLDISERRKPQDGKINFGKYGPLKIELRVATLPTAGGLEDVVLRVLANGEPIPLDEMGIRPESLTGIKQLIAKPYGLFLVCGPTGSGKTTTLHSILGHINTPEKKIWTAEDPVEITQVGLRQVQVNSKIGLTFANAMRAFLRADPDVIMVGEMRDAETTSTGIEASLTGHLVLSTLHTNSATESVVRLLDMGMDPFNFADSLLGILAQRLAKRLCPTCRESHEASDEEISELLEEYGSDVFKSFNDEEKARCKARILGEWKQKFSINGTLFMPKAVGCEDCSDTGYNGRIALHELLVSTNEIKKLIHDRASVTDLGKQAFLQGMVTLKQDGIEKILQGKTDIQQVRMVCIK